VNKIPLWTKKYSNKTGGRDHLGYEYVGVLMLEKLIPGISNITYRARYFSFFAWVIYRFFKSGQPATEKNFQKFLKRKSLVYLFANGLTHLDETATGIDGIDSVVRKSVNENGKSERYQFTSEMIEEYKNNYWVYKQKIEQTGITSSNNDQHIAIPSLTRPDGEKLAMAFEHSIKDTLYFNKYCDKAENQPTFEIPTEVLLEYSQHGGVLELESKPEERRALLNILIKTNSITEHESDNTYISNSTTSGCVARRASLAMYLDCISQTSGEFSVDNLRKYHYFVGSPDSCYQPKPQLIRNVTYWRYFQARQYLVYSIEAIFRAITAFSDGKSMHLSHLFNRLMAEVDGAEVKKATGINLNLNDSLDLTMEKIFANKTGPNEAALHHLLQNKYRVPQPTFFIGISLILLLQVYIRFKPLRDKAEPSWQFCHNMGIEGYFTMEDFFSYIEDKINQRLTTTEFLDSILSERIIATHLNIAMIKLAVFGNDTTHFNLESQIFTTTRVADANMNAPKFQNILNFLSDLGLIESAKRHQHSLTPSGKELLDEYQ